MDDTDLPLVVKKVDMPKEMKLFTIKTAKKAFEKCTTEEEIAAFLQSTFNRKYGPLWMCFAGTNFGAYVTCENHRFIYFYVGLVGVILYQHGSVMHDVILYRKVRNDEIARKIRRKKNEVPVED